MKTRDYNITLLRVFAILLVLLGHSMASVAGHWKAYPVIIQSEFFNKLYQIIYKFHMPLFIAISGYLFYLYLPQKDFQKGWYIKKIRRLLLPFIIILSMYYIPIRFCTGYYKESIVQSFIVTIKKNDVGYLWFLETLFILYSLFALTKSLWHKQIIKTALICFVLYLLWFYYKEYDLFQLGKYAIFFFSGILLCKYTNIIRKYRLYIVIGFAIIMGIFTLFRSYYSNTFIYATYLWVLPELIIISLYCVTTWIEGLYKYSIIKFLDNNTMVFYLFHEPFMNIVLYHLRYKAINPFGMVIILFATGFTVSLLIGYLLRSLNLHFCIGE